jgi:hypothetical protein
MVTSPKPKAKAKAQSWPKRLAKWGLIGAPLLVLVLWVLVNRVEWLGPIVADGLRAVIGKDAVAALEDLGYRIQDRIFRYTRRGEKPKAYWEVPTAESVAPPPEPLATASAIGSASGAAGSATAPPTLAPFHPKHVGPVHQSWSAPGDGQWIPIATPDLPELPPILYKTLLHPDKNRSWAELFVVAMRISDVNIRLIAGTQEPEATVEAAANVARPGRIPETDHAMVIGAFNGGFKTEHGKYGMFIDGVTYVEPRPAVCSIAAFKDGTMSVASWDRLGPRATDMDWWRQTPHCMYENNMLNSRLEGDGAKKWGATLDGETVIRRSAIGIDAAGEVLYVGISNHTTAGVIALGMNHAGAATVAQLDVNFSYPKFVLFERKEPDGPRKAVALAQGFEFSEDEFIRKSSPRDFFYIVPRAKK